ncbi:hypothetical protein DTO164E3_9192 [Paecilomyces variotii]|nr:hypothetical protein DTO164E3_9192 [Paecilomyces variotii]KAJ9190831.1 hypothetical protein DTO032I3_9127 [Paecilomyces variotii]KAJ9273950.1 hypothetical protein DTO021D3_9189 [Paecilomyces variotii]KAJ9338284.1 hypothetical protein DTO027B6_9170 [Paecilomyces variotii]KAJ9375335.1 hypothetical protein DTO032I4_9184 [Paecilomyces variotii]
MVSRKRAHSEVEAESEQQPKEPGLLARLRNCWEFANLMQYIYIFGKVFKIDEEFGIEDLETECLKPGPSEKLLDIGLSLLKFVSSHRGLTRDNFDEYTRRQYNAKAPHLKNPFGYEEEPKKFNDFDVFLKLRVLHQLSVWTFWNPDRLREKMPEQRETEQTQWRIEELGYDREDRLYYVLDDNRLYRRTDPPIPAPKTAKPKANTRKARAAARAAKRRRVSEEDEEEKDDADENQAEDTSGGLKWECIAVTLAEYQAFVDTIRKTKDPNEQILRDRLLEEVFPVLEKIEESQQRKIAKREKELFNMQLLAGAKRSGRLAEKQEREQREREEAEAARKREAELAAARKAQEQQKKMEEERRSRMMTREQRIRDREQKRILHEEELRKMAEEQKKIENGEGRVSERHLKAEMEKRKKSLEELAQEDQWVFDCSGCGVHGKNLDDGSHSVACERCNVWQHSKCLGIPQAEAEKEDFHFVCEDCKRHEEEAKRPKLPPLKFRVGGSSSPPQSIDAVNGEKPKSVDGDASPTPNKLKHVSVPRPSEEVGHGASAQAQNTDNRPIVEQLPPQQLFRQTDGAQESVQTAPAPSSPERRSLSFMNGSSGSDGHLRPPFSPSKNLNGTGMSPVNYLPKFTPGHPPPHSVQQANYTAPPTPHAHLNRGSFNSPRPSSSHSTQSHSFPSPIQNRPPMSPTQGNRDVGPLAGFPSPAHPNMAVSSTPFGQQQTPRPSSASFVASSSGHSRPPSFSAATPTAGNSFSHTPPPPQGAQGIHLSGLSPTKHSPRPMTSGGMGAASVLPPIQRLEPSPKLMGRSSADAPIPPPVKCMTPEQEERRQRENEMMAQAQAPSGQQTGNPNSQ